MTNLLFPHQQLLHERFLQTDVGQLYLAIPFDALAATIPPPRHSISGKGCKPWLDVKGGLALQFLKHYLCLSDALLMERINTDWSLQQFCGLQLKPHEVIRDTNLPAHWRSYLGGHLDIVALQKAFAAHWKAELTDTPISSQDATCYESRIAYPTAVKLVWQCCNKVYVRYQHLRKQTKQRQTRCNYQKWKQAFLEYQKSRKKTRTWEKRLLKKLLKFLHRLLELHKTIVEHKKINLSHKQKAQMLTITKVYEQQHQKVYGKVEQIKDRIVSLSKPYIRPIVRGKEAKAVEFGAKVNKLQVDGLSFIEHFSYDAFNEGTRLKSSIHLHRALFGRCTHHSADQLYATNENRTYCREQNITTNFIPKGRQKPQHMEQSKVMRAVLNKERGTRLEGSFGNEKNHYLLQKVNARNAVTEKCWIFFGMMTANASIIARRREEALKKAA
ncbi:MAG: DDE transposase [Flavisolibacter sp.]|nr:DDE transposase [Flavisolibacter sp.]